mgnify:CR=1 FL=1
MKISSQQISIFTEDESTSFPEGFHVSHTHKQVRDLEKRMNATSGQKCLEQLGRFDQVGLWAKTFSALLIGRAGWFSTRCRLTWKLRGTKYNRMYFQLVPSTLPTEGIGFGLLPTVKTFDATYDRPLTDGKNKSLKTGTEYGIFLSQMAKAGLLPTPKVGGKEGYETRAKRQGHEKAISHLEAFIEYHMLPTPRANDTNSPAPGTASFGCISPNWKEFPTQSPICDGDDGLSSRLDGITFSKWRNESIKAGGNAIVPQVVHQIFQSIQEYENLHLK